MKTTMRESVVKLLLVSVLLGSALISCGGDKGCEGIEPLKAETKQPAVVKLYFQFKNCGGQPVAGLKAGDFVIEEDGEEVSVYESDQNIITDPKNFMLATVLIVDMSGSILASGNLPSLQQAAKAFVSTLGTGQSTAIYTFDGRQDVQKLVDFTTDADALKAGIDSLTDYEVVDKSTNLNGAVISGLSVLDSLESQSEFTGVLFAGSLAVFTDGTDQAGRVNDEVAVADASETTHAVFSIGLGGEVDQSHLKSLGKDGAYFADNVDALESTFQEAAADIEKLAKSYYILAYCSPKRAGTHTLRLTTRAGSGFLEHTFSASGFEGGCSPDDFLTDPVNCEPECDGKECGDNGCGGTCGNCPTDFSCEDGICMEGDAEGTWTDPTSDLIWQVTPTGGTMIWSDAKAHCAGLSLDGGGWHLPTIGELRTLIRGCPGTVTGGACEVTDSCLSFSSCWDMVACLCLSGDSPADGCYWPDEMQGTCTWYWSWSPVEDYVDYAWSVNHGEGPFGNGSVERRGVGDDLLVRCVR